MIDKEYLRDAGYGRQVGRLLERLRVNAQKKKMQLASDWVRMGGTINYSFWEQHEMSYSEEDVCAALCELGCNPDKYPGRKWFAFWKDNKQERIMNAIKSIPVYE